MLGCVLGCSLASLTTGEILAMGWFGQARYRLQGLRASHKVRSRVAVVYALSDFFFSVAPFHNFSLGGLWFLVGCPSTACSQCFPNRYSVFLRAQTLSFAQRPGENSISLAKPRIRESIRTLRPVSRRLFSPSQPIDSIQLSATHSQSCRRHSVFSASARRRRLLPSPRPRFVLHHLSGG